MKPRHRVANRHVVEAATQPVRSLDLAVIAERIEQLRKEKGLSQQALAEYLGIDSHTTVGDWLNKRRPPSADHLNALSERFGVTTDWVLGRAEARKFPDQSGDDGQLDRDLAAHIARELRKQGLMVKREWVGSRDILADAVEATAAYYRELIHTVRTENEKAATRTALFVLFRAPNEKDARRAVVDEMKKHPLYYSIPPHLVGGPRYLASPSMHKALDRWQRDFAPDGTMRPEVQAEYDVDWEEVEADNRPPSR